MSIRDAVPPIARAYLAWWFHSWRCMWKGNLGIFGYDNQDKLVMIACSCGRDFWVQP